MGNLAKTHIFIQIAILFSVAMLIPSIHAFLTDQSTTGRAFLYASLSGVLGLSFIVMALSNRNMQTISHRSQLLTLISLFTILPALLAIPFHEAHGNTSFSNAYLEMVSCLTTTGFRVFDPDRLNDSLHIWRAIVAWLGGFFMWCAAWAIFAPLNLGGYDHLSRGSTDVALSGAFSRKLRAEPGPRLISEFKRLFPIYVTITAICFLGLSFAGMATFDSMFYAMGVVSTSGITPTDLGWGDGAQAFGIEAVIFLILLTALSRNAYNGGFTKAAFEKMSTDRELKAGLILVCIVSLSLFLKNMIGPATISAGPDVENLAATLWGRAFTALSFLTTTGYVASGWAEAQFWSGLSGTGLILLGLCLIGGGVATTAGGIKLIRVIALMEHSRSEMLMLISPSQVLPARNGTIDVRLRTAMMAWVFFMMFALVLALILLGVAGFGLNFQEGLLLTVSALANTGPLHDVVGNMPQPLAQLDSGIHVLLVLAMVLGRLEILVFIALLNREIWR